MPKVCVECGQSFTPRHTATQITCGGTSEIERTRRREKGYRVERQRLVEAARRLKL